MRCILRWVVVLVGLGLPVTAQDLRGHGGPVGALDAGQGLLLSGGFDTRAILWDIADGTARNVTRFHDGNVTAVRLLPDAGFVTAGQDGRLAVWQADGRAPHFVTPPAVSAVASLAVTADGAQVAAGFWDGQIVRLDLATLQTRTFRAHSDRVTGLVFLPEGDLVSVGGDLSLARWTMQSGLVFRQDMPGLPNGLALSDDLLAVIFADGALRLYTDQATVLAERFLTDRPLVAVAAGAQTIAAAALDGTIWLVQGDDLAPRRSFRAAEGPVWGVAVATSQVFTSGADGIIRRWSLDGAETLPPPVAAASDPRDSSRGAEVWKNCAVCHALAPNDHSMAGPSLYAIFGRAAGSQPGYEYSAALRQLDIVWTPQTLSDLFTYGPEAYTPGSRMPEQRIADPADRAALVDYLEKITAAGP